MPKIWRKAIEQELDEKDVEFLNILAGERKFGEGEIKKLCQKAKLKIEKLIEGKFMWVGVLKT